MLDDQSLSGRPGGAGGAGDIEIATPRAISLATLTLWATELLIEEVTEPKPHRHRQVVFEPDLVARESTIAS